MIVMDRFAAWMLFVAVGVCSVGAVALFTLTQFGWLMATLVAIPMTLLIGAMVFSLSRTARITR